MTQMKPYAVIFFLFFCGFSPSVAQTNTSPYEVKIDSLQTLIDRQTNEDTLKVKRLSYLARACFYDLQYQRGLVATVQSRQLAKKLRYATGEALYWRNLFTFNRFGGIGLDDYYSRREDWFYADRGQKVDLNQFRIQLPPGRSDKAKTELEKAMAYFEKQPDKEILANIHFQYATILQLTIAFGSYDRYHESLDKAADLFRKNNQETLAFFCILQKVPVLEQFKKTKEAREAENTLQRTIAQTPKSRDAAALSYWLGYLYEVLNRKAASFEYYQKADQTLEQLNEKNLRLDVLRRLGILCQSLGLTKKAVEYFKKEVSLREQARGESDLIWIYRKVAFTLIELKAFDEARSYINKAAALSDKKETPATQLNNKIQHYDATGQLLLGQGNAGEAIQNFNQALTEVSRLKDLNSFQAFVLEFYQKYNLARSYQKLGNVAESINYGKMSYDLAAQLGRGDGLVVKQKTSLLLAEEYDKAKKPLDAYKYLKIHQQLQNETGQNEAANRLLDLEVQSVVEKEEKEKNRLKEEQLLQEQRILAIEKEQEIDRLKAQSANQSLQSRAEQAELGRQLDKQRLEAKALQDKKQQDYQISLLNLDIDNQRKIRTGLLAGLGLFALFAALLFRQNRTKQRLNKILTEQKAEIEQQHNQLDQSLNDLKNTQTQLIQKEKLASLGELTAGIAHEIQNPLNFVNNFSEVSADLVAELKEEAEAGRVDDVLDIADSLILNMQKINHHGGRAAAIVRGMLEHSRIDAGERRPTDLNALVNEYLNIAYHGQQAKDKNGSRFECQLVRDFAPNLAPIDIAPQEIGRVLQNLYANAFYAVRERQKAPHPSQENYQPTVWVSTKRAGRGVEIRVRDNGTGIPDSVKAKIFQPFFTTKPTGEGTGLGLSLSYDIITKGHSGTLTAETTEGEGTTFIITLPTIKQTS